jgi:Flp pilus assembly protein TadG
MKLNKQSGQVLVGTAVAMVVLAGFAGLAIDMGTLRYQKRLQQTAADAAAIAGASNLGYSSTSWSPGAINAATQNGFSNPTGDPVTTCTAAGAAIGTICVQVSNPPTTGPHSTGANAPKYVEVFVAEVQPTYFMKIFGVNSQTVVARAVATNTGGGAAGGGGCIYTLGTPSKQLNFNKAGIGSTGTNYIKAPTCGIVDNGNFVANGNVSVKAGSIGVGGDVNLPNNSTPDCTSAQPAGVCPTPVTGMPYSGDPFTGKYPIPTSPGAGSVTTVSGVTTYSPGTYSGGITVNSSTNAVFSPGVYVIDGGTFKVNGGANVCGGGIASFSGSVMTSCTQAAGADGVTFYITNGASVQINGTSNTQMYAPNLGQYEGLLFYQDPADTQQATINGTDNSLFQGAIYMPTADLDFSGTSSFNNGAAYTVIVTDQLLVSGGAYVNLASNFSGLTNGGGPLTGVTQWPTLVE